jgi:hypothetical protein
MGTLKRGADMNKKQLNVNDLIIIINENYHPAKIIHKEDSKQSLFSEEIDFEARDLLLLLYFLERKYSVRVSSKQINKGRLDTIDKLVAVVNEAKEE